MVAEPAPSPLQSPSGPGHLALDVGRFTWCPAADPSVVELDLAAALGLLQRPRPGHVPSAPAPDAEPTTTPLERATLIQGLPVLAAVGDGAHAYADATQQWISLGADHLRVLSVLGPSTPAGVVLDALPDLAPQLPALVADLAALGIIAVDVADLPHPAPLPPRPTPVDAPERPKLLRRALRAVRRTPRAEPTAAPDPGPAEHAEPAPEPGEATAPAPAPVDPRWWSGTGSVPVYSFWATDEGPPVGVASVVAYARAVDGGRLTETYDLRLMAPPQVVLDDLARTHGPAIVLCGNYDWSLDANLAVIEEARRLRPDVVVVHGGPSTPSSAHDCEPFLRALPGRHVAVAGEGEITFVELLDRLAATDPAGEVELDLRRLHDVAGLRFVDPDTDAYVHGPARPRHDHLEDFPSPLAGGELALVPDDALNIIPIETNRGCPYSCTFCDWGAATMSRLRQFPLERVRSELAWMAEHGVTTWYIADANFGIVARDVEIARDVADYRARTGFPHILVAFPAKNATDRYLEIIDTFISSGITLKAALALQTRDAATLKAVKRSNIKTESYDQLAAESRRRGLPMLTELMIGLPGSTVASFKDDLQWGIERQVRAFLYPTVVLPNAPLNDPGQRELLQIRTVDGRLVSSSSFTEDDRAEMDRVAAAYHCLEVFGTLRHVLRYLQWDHGLRAIDVIHRVVLVADADPERYPLTALHLRHAENFLVPPVGWAPLFQELHRLLVDELEVPDGSGLRTALAASRHLLTWPGRTLPASIELEHDYVAYFQSTQASLFETGEPGTPTRPLHEHGPGTLEITADPLGVSQLFGRWEENDPFQQAEDFEPLSPLRSYHSSVGALTS